MLEDTEEIAAPAQDHCFQSGEIDGAAVAVLARNTVCAQHPPLAAFTAHPPRFELPLSRCGDVHVERQMLERVSLDSRVDSAELEHYETAVEQ